MRDFPMDDEKRRKLLNDLRNADLPDSVMCDEAAEELEWLVKKNARLVWENARLVWENRELKTELDDS